MEHLSTSHSVKTRIWQSSLMLILRFVGSLLINVVGGVLLAHWLGPHAWGIYTISLFLLVAYQSVLEKGLVAYLIQKSADLMPHDKSVAYAIQIGLGFLCLGFALVLAPLAVAWYGYAELNALIVAVGITGFAYSLRSVPLALLERELKYAQVGAIEIVDLLIFNVIALICVGSGWGIQGLVVANIARGVGSALLAIIWTGVPRWVWHGDVARRMLDFGTSVFVANMFKILTSAADPVLVATLVSAAALGFVQVTLTWLSYLAVVAGILARVSFSALSRIQERDADIHQLSNANLEGLAKLIIPPIAGLAGSAPFWVERVYGTQWAPMASIFLIAALPFAAGQILLALTASLYAKGRAQGMMIFLGFYGATYWAASYILLPRWGVLGTPLALWCVAPLWLILIRDYRRNCGALDLRLPLQILGTSGLLMLGIFLCFQWRIDWLGLFLVLGLGLWWLNLSRAWLLGGIRFLWQPNQ